MSIDGQRLNRRPAFLYPIPQMGLSTGEEIRSMKIGDKITVDGLEYVITPGNKHNYPNLSPLEET